MYGEDDDFIQDEDDEEGEAELEDNVIAFPDLAQASASPAADLPAAPPPPRPDAGPDIVQMNAGARRLPAPPSGREATAGVVTGTLMILSSIWLGHRLELRREPS